MVKIEAVSPGGSAALAGLQAGDDLVAINGRNISDILDYFLALDARHLQLEVLRGATPLQFQLATEEQLDPGLQIEHPEPTHCGNNCPFCFVHQLPRGLRKTLYVKDEDYRFSYLYGSYVTLSNIDQFALQRIIDEQLSPLYVSVHATDENLRTQLLGRESPPIFELLQRLTAASIEIHCQIVVCPGINDGPALRRSIETLYRLAPGIGSLAVVPVGLTRFRDKLPVLRGLTERDAEEVIDMIETCQRQFLEAGGSRFVFAADEIYLRAGRELPDLAAYEELWQLENGVGMVAQFRQEAQEVLQEADPLELQRVTVLTGCSFAPELKAFARRLARRTGVRIDVRPIRNRFFGEQVTVAGLLTGRDLLEQLAGKDLGAALLLPEVMLKDDRDVFLDDLTLTELSERLQVPVVKIAGTPWGVLDGLEELACGATRVVRCDG
jgi:putative radical SAM enzyme (TIGR03279 family)